FRAGTRPQAYTVTASLDLGEGHKVIATTTISTALPTIHYLWKQTTLDWHQEGSTRWPDKRSATQPDCTDYAGFAFFAGQYCVDRFVAGPDPKLPVATVQRRGTISFTAGGAGYELTEELTDTRAGFQFESPNT